MPARHSEQPAAEALSPLILEGLRGVTKLSEEKDYDQFIQSTLENPLSCAVKLNDLTDNMDVRRMPQVTEKDIARLNKYLKAYRIISAHRIRPAE